MRNRFLPVAILLLLLFAAALPLRAATLRGLVPANEPGGAPLSNVDEVGHGSFQAGG